MQARRQELTTQRTRAEVEAEDLQQRMARAETRAGTTRRELDRLRKERADEEANLEGVRV